MKYLIKILQTLAFPLFEAYARLTILYAVYATTRIDRYSQLADIAKAFDPQLEYPTDSRCAIVRMLDLNHWLKETIISHGIKIRNGEQSKALAMLHDYDCAYNTPTGDLKDRANELVEFWFNGGRFPFQFSMIETLVLIYATGNYSNQLNYIGKDHEEK